MQTPLPDLSPILALSTAVNSTLNLTDICTTACRIACERLGVSHTAFVLFDADLQAGRVLAEYPEAVGALGMTIPLAEVEEEQSLIDAAGIIEVANVNEDLREGVFKRNLQKLGVTSVLVVPVQGKQRLHGSFSLDSIGNQRIFSHQEKQFCHLFAAQIAVAIENARAYEAVEHKAMQMEALRAASLAVMTNLDRKTVLDQILAKTVHLLNARSCGVYEYDSDRNDLTIIAVHGDDRHIGKRLNFGEGIAGRLIASGDDYTIVPNYASSPFREVFTEVGLFEAVLEVPLKHCERTIGVLYVEAPVTRNFKAEPDAVILRQFAEPASIALLNSEILQRATTLSRIEQHRTVLLERLEHCREGLRNTTGDTALRASIVELAVELVGWSAGGLYRYVKDYGELQLVHNHGVYERGARLVVSEGDGLVGRVALTKMLETVPADGSADFDRARMTNDFAAVTAIPIFRYRELDSVLLLLDPNKEDTFRETDREILVRFAGRAATILQAQDVLEKVNINLEFLHLVSGDVSDPQELDTILYNVLTAVTAKFGLKFNRALLFVLDETGERLEGRTGVGHFDLRDWERDCEKSATEGTDTFEGWLRERESVNPRPLTPIAAWLQGKSYDLSTPTWALVRTIIEEERLSLTQELPLPLQEALMPETDVILVPLHDGRQVIGVLLADKKFTRQSISYRDQLGLKTLCSTAATSISNHAQYSRIVSGTETLSDAASSLVLQTDLSAHSEESLLARILEHTRTTFAADVAAVFLTDRHGRQRCLVFQGTDRVLSSDYIAPVSLSKLALPQGLCFIVKDTGPLSEAAGELLKRFGARVAVCMPLSYEDRQLGLLWAFCRNPLGIRRVDSLTLERYASQAGNLYGNWLRLNDLMELHRSVQTISQLSELLEVTEAIVIEARRIFEADCATLWPYDARNDIFLVDDVATEGFRGGHLSPPARNNITHNLVQPPHYIAVGDILNVSNTRATHEFLRTNSMRSYQGIGLVADGEVFGILYVTYSEARDFGVQEQRRLKNFADYAALVLRFARTVARLRKAHEAVEEVGRILVMGNANATLRSVAQKTRDAVGCNVITLFQWDDADGTFDFPPIAEGCRHPELIEAQDRADAERLVPMLITKSEPIKASNPREMELFRSQFAEREGVRSVVAVPLISGRRRVGLMFASYRTQQRFSQDDIKELQLFADQAAVAIGNAMRYRQLASLSNDLLGRSQDEILTNALAIVQDQLGIDMCNIILEQQGVLRVVKSRGWPPEHLTELAEWGVKSHAGYTILKKAPIIVRDFRRVREDPATADLEVPERIFRAGIVSGMSVPVMHGDEVFGAMLVHHKSERVFPSEDVYFLSMVANQVVGTWRRYRDLNRQRASLQALFNAAKVISRTQSKQKPVLAEILKLAISSIVDHQNIPKAYFGTIQLYDAERDALVFESVYPPFRSATVKIGQSKALMTGNDAASRVGITGIVARTRKILRVSDAPHHDQYTEFMADTKSELVAPLLDGDTLIGVINLESRHLAAFDKEDEATIAGIAELAAIAIQRSDLEQKLEAESRTFSRLLGATIHDLRNRFQPISLDIDAFIAGDYKNHKQEYDLLLQRLGITSGQYRRLIDNIEYSVHILQRKIVPSPKLESLRSIINNVRSDFQHAAESQGVNLRVEMPEGSVLEVTVDRKLLEVVLSNLIDNGIRFNRRDGVVEIRVDVGEPKVMIWVEDTGNGIPAHEQKRVFDEFFQGQGHSAAGQKGMGLGLHLCRIITRVLGGDVELVRSTPGQGSTFLLSLPRAGTL